MIRRRFERTRKSLPLAPKEAAPLLRAPKGRTAIIVFLTATVLTLSQPRAREAAGPPSLQAREARIVEVTVFPDRAEAVREVSLELPRGASRVEFPDLPWDVEADSLRVMANGVPMSLGAVELGERVEEPHETPETVAARAEVERIGRELQALAGQDHTAAELRAFVTSIKVTAAAQTSERLAAGGVDPASLQGVYSLIRRSLDELAADKLAREEATRRLNEQLEVARARLAAGRPAGRIRSRVATVDVFAEKAGPATLKLAYLAPNASWRPSYRATLDPATGGIEMVSEAVVRQLTGEDWTGVRLRLSTAAPARSVRPPRLASLLLRPVEPPKATNQDARSGGYVTTESLTVTGKFERDASVQGRNYRSELTLAPGDADEPKKDAERVQAGLLRSSWNVTFEVPGAADVPSDRAEHRVGLRREMLGGELEYRTMPGLAESAWMIARAKAPEGYPMLAGPVRVFAEGAYLGSYPIGETSPGEEIEIPFGVDNRVTIERTPMPRRRGEEGLIGKDTRIVYGFRTVVENLRDRPVSVKLEDRVPVSEDERIRVEIEKGSTPSARKLDDRPGVLEWTLDLGPGEKREVVLEYSVRYPKDLIVPDPGDGPLG